MTGLRLAELCAGYGGLGLGLAAAGVDADPAWFAETDPAASTVMEAHHDAPNFGDITALTDPPPADIVAAGFPCQPVSSAGRRAGTDDDRWIISDVCRVAAVAGARWLVLENVASILGADGGRAMAEVACAMAGAGFRRWEWCTLRASDVGAPHRRDRWFCVAHADEAGRPVGHAEPGDGQAPDARRGPSESGGRGGAAADANSSGRQGPGPAPGRLTVAAGDRPAVAGTDSNGRSAVADLLRESLPDGSSGRFGPYAAAVARWERILGRPAPAPTDDRGRLSPLLVEWMMGLPAGWVTECGLARTVQLRVLGNGVVPQQAAAAIRELAA